VEEVVVVDERLCKLVDTHTEACGPLTKAHAKWWTRTMNSVHTV
jgi:hypothetical protein